MDLRQLEAFVAVATELHFGRAAEKLYIGQPTMSDLIRRLERELGTPLLTRTTRQVALTEAGHELLTRSKVILADVAAAAIAVKRIAGGEGGTVRVGITPPVAPVLAPHLLDGFARAAPGVTVTLQRMWLPILSHAVANGSVDVAITCGLVDEPAGVVNEIFCAEPLLVALRPGHRFAGRRSVALADLAYDVLGAPQENLFPAWAISQRQALEAAGISPPSVPLEDTDLSGSRWLQQPGIDWIILIASLTAPHADAIVRPIEPLHPVPFTLQWSPVRAESLAVARFVQHALAAELPDGWLTRPNLLLPVVTVDDSAV